MPREKLKNKIIKHHICRIARVVACVSFLILAVIGVSSLAKAMSLENVENQNGIPSSWQIASLGHPSSITVPISYWDQRQDECDDENRQFEWTICHYWTAGTVQGIVRDTLGSDGLPVPTYSNSTEAWAANHDVFTANVTGNNPVQPTDNFYRWFHDTAKSKQYDREITFQQVGDGNTYVYGGQNIFPLDNVDFSKDDSASASNHSDDRKTHNFHFTAHMTIPMKIAADGSELFEFSGDDDVWVFLNGKLVLDIGGLHEALNGSFRINSDGTVTTYVQNVNDVSQREQLGKPNLNDPSRYVNALNDHNRKTYQDTTKTIDIGLKAGDIVNLDFFYAERSTTASNTKITISNMEWPISAGSDVQGKIVGKVEGKDSNLIQYDTYVKNRDPQNPLDLVRLSSYITDRYTDQDSQAVTNSGFIPLDVKTLQYTTTPEDDSSWQYLDITAPTNSLDGFKLNNPLTMQPSGQAGDTLYFRFVAETSEYSGTISNITAYYTELNGVGGVTYDNVSLPYTGKSVDDTPKEYDLNIHYVIDFGDTEPDDTVAPDDVHQKLTDGATYDVTSPTIDGFTPDFKKVEGKINGKDVNITVTYTRDATEDPDPVDPTPQKHKVVIHYVKDDGSKAFDDYVGMHDEGEQIHIPSNELEHYTPSDEYVELTVPAGGIERTVIYTPVRHTVTVHYVYENGATAHEDYVKEYGYGESFSIVSPDITGYRKDIAEVSGVMSDHDRVFTVTYTLITPVGPVIPDQPDTPTPPVETPEEPEQPSQPEPDDNLIPSVPVTPDDDDELTYLGPLGEVAYVPNTGVISDFIAPIFEQYFAEMILSQGFILTMLLIFAGSFATYFSLRRYMDLNIATRTTRTSVPKKMPRNLNHNKTRKSTSTAKKSTKRK